MAAKQWNLSMEKSDTYNVHLQYLSSYNQQFTEEVPVVPLEKNGHNEYLDPEFSAVMGYKVQDTLPFHLHCELNML